MSKDYSQSLLYKLQTREIDQIIRDYRDFNEVKFNYFIDAHDILEYLDPFKFLFEQRALSSDLNLIADQNFAIRYIFNRTVEKCFLLKEYRIELNSHKKKINQFQIIDNKIIDNIIRKQNESFDKLSNERLFLESSKIIFLISGASKSIYQRFTEIIKDKEITVYPKLEDDYFPKYKLFSSVEKNKIALIYELFDVDIRSKSMKDAIAIYKTFVYNANCETNNRYIYFSSPHKSKTVRDKIVELTNTPFKENDPWNWFKGILSKHPEEKLVFFRDKSYSFGFAIYKKFILTSRFESESLNNLFKRYCKNPKKIEKVYNVVEEKVYREAEKQLNHFIHKNRESLENKAVLSQSLTTINKFSKLNLRDNKLLRELRTNFNKLLLDSGYEQDKNGYRSIIEVELGVDDLKFDLLYKLKEYCISSELKLDRGKDGIISLLNTIPPIFIYSFKNNNFKKFQALIVRLLTHAQENRQEVNKNIILQLLEDSGKLEKNWSFLIYIYLTIFIEYSVDNEDSNTIAYNYSVKFEEYLISEINISSSSKSKVENEYILQELRVLKNWSLRRQGLVYTDSLFIKIYDEHNQLIKDDYKEDYRFDWSLFLFKIDLFFSFKNASEILDINSLISYVEDAIVIGNNTLFKLEDENSTKIDNTAIFKLIKKTIKNGLLFIFCVKIDLVLHAGKEVKEQIRLEYLEKIKKLKENRKPYNKGDNLVFQYVEAYSEYLESFLLKNETDKKSKLKHGTEAINQALINLLDDKDRKYFNYRCEILSKLIDKKRKNLTYPYESFIMSMDDRKTFREHSKK